ncbi:MAG: glycosyl hydrolase family 16 [Flavobacterium sp. BFFFF2]|nr:MAG: glycosyl hydrolase family 16 [Flavobacterium sp. BFFFF2]
MENRKINYLRNALLFGLIILVNISCERNLSDEAKNATFPKTAYVFNDAPVAMGTNFYFPYGGSKATAWSIDSQVSYKGTASMRFDVPNENDTEGNYAGAIFRVDGTARDLTGFDALTFYAKASQGVIPNAAGEGGCEFGFGEDFFPNKYITSITKVSVGTAWTKYIIPIPDASKLIQEKGMFRIAAGTQNTGGAGYSLWIDELKFEKLGTILPLNASIMNGANVTRTTFVGVTSVVNGVVANFNMPNGINQSVTIAPAYLNFASSNPSVATVNDAGVVTPISAGTATITATFNGQPTTGSLIINCTGSYVKAPTPTLNASNVISIFSDAYTNVPVAYYNGYWQPWQTTVSNDFSVNGDNVLNYTNFNFVGIEFSNPTVNATSMTHIHLDAFIPGPIASGRQLRVIVVDFGADGVYNGGDDTRHSTTFTATTSTPVVSQNWISIEIPFSAMPNLASRSHLAQIILEGGDNSILYVDNIYFHN